MTGKSHIAMGAISLGIASEAMFSSIYSQTALCNVSASIKSFVLDNQTIKMPIFIILSLILFVLGCLLPDIDTPYSTLGKIICIPIEHRTWTHAIYLPIVLCLIGIKYRFIFWLALGVICHDLCDSVSMSGLNWFYPAKNKHHVFKLYYTSHMSEYVFVFVYAAVFVVYTIFSIYKFSH